LKVKLWLEVCEGHFMGSSWLWHKTLETGQVPAHGDHVILWGDDGDPQDGPLWGVQRRYWGADGSVHVSLAKMIVDPTEESRQGMMRAAVLGDRGESPWWTATDGLPGPKLEAGGWSCR